jgi:hypothetical protein
MRLMRENNHILRKQRMININSQYFVACFLHVERFDVLTGADNQPLPPMTSYTPQRSMADR